MRRVLPVVPLILVSVAAPTPAADRGGPSPPRLDVRAQPRIAFAPATVLVTGQLVGGDDLEEFYCPALEWDWGDGGRSAQEGDCPPFASDTKMARRFSARHAYREAGAYEIRLTLRRANRAVVAGSITIRVDGGEGEPAVGWAALP